MSVTAIHSRVGKEHDGRWSIFVALVKGEKTVVPFVGRNHPLTASTYDTHGEAMEAVRKLVNEALGLPPARVAGSEVAG